MQKIITTLIMGALLVGCASSWKETGSTVLTASGAVAIGLEDAYLTSVRLVAEECSQDPQCTAVALAGAKAIDTLQAIWYVAYKAWEAGNKRHFADAVACVLASLRAVAKAMSDWGYSRYNEAINSAISLGELLMSQIGGSCI